MRRHVRVAAAVLLVLAPPAWAGGQAPLPVATPESEGFVPERLARLDRRMQEYVDAGRHAGIVVLIARDGKIVELEGWGFRDVERRLPMQRDTIVRIYSMSKVITSVAVMQLVEQARLKLTDPVEKYLPALAKPMVLVGGSAKKPKLVAAKRSVTIKDLLTHTAGYQYPDFRGTRPYDVLYAEAKVFDAPDMDELVRRFAKVPLAYQPGERFGYGLGLDLLGAVVQAVAGQPFERYVAEHICDPLGMVDTAYSVPPSKRDRLAIVYTTGTSGGLEPAKETVLTSVDGSIAPWGGAGMFSTIVDYARFGQMLLNGGELDGVRILGRKTVELMEANHLNELANPMTSLSRGDGFGLGGAVRTDLARGNVLGSVGQFGWSGAATTSFSIDPKEHTLTLAFTQHFPNNQHGMLEAFSTLFYASLGR